MSGWVVVSRRLAPYLDLVVGVLAVVVAVAVHVRTDLGVLDPRLEQPDVLSTVATMVAAGALAWRRTRPFVSYAVMVLGCLVVSLTGHYIGLLSMLVLVSLYSFAVHGRRRDALVGLFVGVGCFVGLAVLDVPDLGTAVLLQSIALLVAAWALGDAIRSRRRHQQDRVEAAVAEERLRIARELHDVVAHSMSLIAVQAGAGAHVIDSDVAAAKRSLETIADTSRQALEQTRSMLGMLREFPEDRTRPPTQGLGDVRALVDDLLAAGLEVTLSCPDPVPELDAASSLAAFRILQESLTNVIRHSAARTATVHVTADPAQLLVEVVDPGPHRPRSTTRATTGTTLGTGHGLVGLQERARLIGGRLEAGAHGSGFRVLATLPLQRHP